MTPPMAASTPAVATTGSQPGGPESVEESREVASTNTGAVVGGCPVPTPACADSLGAGVPEVAGDDGALVGSCVRAFAVGSGSSAPVLAAAERGVLALVGGTSDGRDSPLLREALDGWGVAPVAGGEVARRSVVCRDRGSACSRVFGLVAGLAATAGAHSPVG